MEAADNVSEKKKNGQMGGMTGLPMAREARTTVWTVRTVRTRQTGRATWERSPTVWQKCPLAPERGGCILAFNVEESIVATVVAS